MLFSTLFKYQLIVRLLTFNFRLKPHRLEECVETSVTVISRQTRIWRDRAQQANPDRVLGMKGLRYCPKESHLVSFLLAARH